MRGVRVMETMKGEGDAEGQRERFGCEFNQSAQGHLVQSVWAAHVSFTKWSV